MARLRWMAAWMAQLGVKCVGEVELSTLPVKMYIDWIRVYE